MAPPRGLQRSVADRMDCRLASGEEGDWGEPSCELPYLSQYASRQIAVVAAPMPTKREHILPVATQKVYNKMAAASTCLVFSLNK